MTMVSTRTVIVLADLLAKTKKTRNGCMEWNGAKKERGYGILRYKGRRILAHRLAMHLAQEFDLDSELYVCHHCDNPPCLNPAHLYVGDPATNGRDRIRRGTVSAISYRITYEQLKLIHDLVKLEVPLDDIVRVFRVSKTTINKLINYAKGREG